MYLKEDNMIGFIGAGQVGTALGIYFHNMGLTVSGYYSKSLESAIKSSKRTHSKAYEHIHELIDSSEYIIITTPDDAICDVVKKLCSIKIDWNDKVICHTSGALSSTLLNPIFQLGATTLSLHPMLSFADIDYAVEILRQTPLTLEGKGTLMSKFKNMLENASLTIHEININQKALYHASACIVSNYLVTLMDIGISSLEQAGFTRKNATQLIAPLATGTLQNVLTKGIKNSLTGPISRGDINTIKTHLDTIVREDKELEQIYRLLGKRTINIAKEQNQLDEYTLIRLKEVLQNEKNNN
jgi:predicted short-subunit dehydrogenase-like oxidoreductase (DUF2520 family)